MSAGIGGRLSHEIVGINASIIVVKFHLDIGIGTVVAHEDSASSTALGATDSDSDGGCGEEKGSEGCENWVLHVSENIQVNRQLFVEILRFIAHKNFQIWIQSVAFLRDFSRRFVATETLDVERLKTSIPEN